MTPLKRKTVFPDILKMQVPPANPPLTDHDSWRATLGATPPPLCRKVPHWSVHANSNALRVDEVPVGIYGNNIVQGNVL